MARIIAMLALLLAWPAAAQEDSDSYMLGGDVFVAGTAVTLGEGHDDVFAAGERVTVEAPATGSAYLAGRRVTTDAEIGGDLHAFGADVTVNRPVAGDAILAGYDVDVAAEIGEDLRASGAHVRLTAPVAGTAMLTGRTVFVDGAIEGDATISAQTLDFGPDARIGGTLTLHGPATGMGDVPAAVAPSDRIDRELVPTPGDAPGDDDIGWLAIGVGFAVGVLVLGLLALIVAVLAPERLERLRDIAGARPFRTFGIGFLALSALIGATVLAALTVIGLLAAPVLLALAVILSVLGYLVGVYLVGRALWGRFDNLPPDSLGERAATALLGALVVSLIALIPFLGWLVLLILALSGLGALTVAWLRPEFRADA